MQARDNRRGRLPFRPESCPLQEPVRPPKRGIDSWGASRVRGHARNAANLWTDRRANDSTISAIQRKRLLLAMSVTRTSTRSARAGQAGPTRSRAQSSCRIDQRTSWSRRPLELGSRPSCSAWARGFASTLVSSRSTLRRTQSSISGRRSTPRICSSRSWSEPSEPSPTRQANHGRPSRCVAFGSGLPFRRSSRRRSNRRAQCRRSGSWKFSAMCHRRAQRSAGASTRIGPGSSPRSAMS